MRTRMRSPCRTTQRVDAGKDTAVPCPEIEIGHGGDLRQIAAGIDVIGAHEEDEIAIDAMQVRIARVHDDRAHHPHRHLHHFVGVRVVHEGAALRGSELVDESLARLDVRLGQPADAVHTVRQQHAVPMDGRVLGQLVGDEDANLVALDAFDGRPRRLAVVAPQMRLHAGSHLAHDRLGDEMKLLPVAVHAPRQRPAVEGNDRLVGGPARRNERRLHAGEVEVTASGIAAACTRPLTAAAPARMAEPPMRLRRVRS